MVAVVAVVPCELENTVGILGKVMYGDVIAVFSGGLGAT